MVYTFKESSIEIPNGKEKRAHNAVRTGVYSVDQLVTEVPCLPSAVGGAVWCGVPREARAGERFG